jgi:hypothetical protein
VVSSIITAPLVAFVVLLKVNVPLIAVLPVIVGLIAPPVNVDNPVTPRVVLNEADVPVKAPVTPNVELKVADVPVIKPLKLAVVPNKAPAIPTPPATLNAPVVVDVEAVTSSTITAPFVALVVLLKVNVPLAKVLPIRTDVMKLPVITKLPPIVMFPVVEIVSLATFPENVALLPVIAPENVEAPNVLVPVVLVIPPFNVATPVTVKVLEKAPVVPIKAPPNVVVPVVFNVPRVAVVADKDVILVLPNVVASVLVKPPVKVANPAADKVPENEAPVPVKVSIVVGPNVLEPPILNISLNVDKPLTSRVLLKLEDVPVISPIVVAPNVLVPVTLITLFKVLVPKTVKSSAKFANVPVMVSIFEGPKLIGPVRLVIPPFNDDKPPTVKVPGKFPSVPPPPPPPEVP